MTREEYYTLCRVGPQYRVPTCGPLTRILDSLLSQGYIRRAKKNHRRYTWFVVTKEGAKAGELAAYEEWVSARQNNP